MKTHMELSIERDIDRIRRKVQEMALLVEQSLQSCIKAIAESSHQLTYTVVLRDQHVNEKEMEIDRLCLEFLVRQQPVALPLRFAYSTIKINLEIEREFFQYFIAVEDIGPLKAVKALEIPVREIATAIESGDLGKLTQLKGIGRRTAQKIIATLGGKMGKFALIRPAEDQQQAAPAEDFAQQVLDVMVKQLGHKPADARQMIAKALKRNQTIATAEALFDEVYRGEKMDGN